MTTLAHGSSMAVVESAEDRWFDGIELTGDPWRYWFRKLRFPRHSPLDAEIERHVESVCRAADARRLAMMPTTKHFAQMWATFRQHHENLEGGSDYRRKRWLTWRAAALRTMLDLRLGLQDDADAAAIHIKLAETMREFGPIAADGSYGGGNFWQPSVIVALDGKPHRPDPLAEYAAMVLVLVRATAGDRR